MSVRRNNVAVIADLAPRTIAWLSIPLTPARAARLADFTARTGVPAQDLVIDLLDDMIFDMTPQCITVLAGASTPADNSSRTSAIADRPSAIADKPSPRSAP